MDDLLPRFAAHLSDLGVTTGVGAALPVGPGVQSTTVRLTRGTSTRAYRLLHGPTVSLADAGPARGVEPPTLVFTSFMTPRSAQALRRAGGPVPRPGRQRLGAVRWRPARCPWSPPS